MVSKANFVLFPLVNKKKVSLGEPILVGRMMTLMTTSLAGLCYPLFCAQS